MQKSSIVQEFINVPVAGTNVMTQKTNFMCGTLMDIQDTITVGHQYNGYNLDLTNNVHNLLHKLSYDNIKKNSIIKLTADPSQSELESNTTTKWIFEFDSNYLLTEVLYNEIYTTNPESPFRLIDNNASQLCYDYIRTNLLSRYKMSQFILWTEFYDLKSDMVSKQNTNIIIDSELNPDVKLLYKTPEFSLNAIPYNDDIKSQKNISIKPYSDGVYEISYKQDKSSQYYTFIYYFDVIFEKI